MSMSTHIVGFKPPDETWKNMKAIYDACTNAGMDPPDKVVRYFNGSKPDEHGVTVEIEELEKDGAVEKYMADMKDGYEIYLDKIPKDIKVIRVYNSY